MKRVFLIHGWDGTPDGNWFPWLSWELKVAGWEVSLPQMPHAAEPKVAEWISFLRDYVGKPDKDTYFVGHSLGCLAIARYLEALPAKTKVGGCVFVAGCSSRLDIPELALFFHIPFDPEKTKLHTSKFAMIFSDNDSYVPLEKSLAFAKELGAKTIMERGRGHFTTEDGVIALPSALSALIKMSS